MKTCWGGTHVLKYQSTPSTLQHLSWMRWESTECGSCQETKPISLVWPRILTTSLFRVVNKCCRLKQLVLRNSFDIGNSSCSRSFRPMPPWTRQPVTTQVLCPAQAPKISWLNSNTIERALETENKNSSTLILITIMIGANDANCDMASNGPNDEDIRNL